MGVQQEDSEENFTQNLPTQHADTHTVTHCPPPTHKHTLEHFCFLFKLFQCHKNSKQEKEKELS